MSRRRAGRHLHHVAVAIPERVALVAEAAVDSPTAVDYVVTGGAVHTVYVVVADATEHDVGAAATLQGSARVVPRSLFAAESP